MRIPLKAGQIQCKCLKLLEPFKTKPCPLPKKCNALGQGRPERAACTYEPCTSVSCTNKAKGVDHPPIHWSELLRGWCQTSSRRKEGYTGMPWECSSRGSSSNTQPWQLANPSEEEVARMKEDGGEEDEGGMVHM